MQQATVNLFADMGAPADDADERPRRAPRSRPTRPRPSSTITSPSAGAAIADGSTVTISGTASDAGGAGGGRRGLDRRRHDLASGHGHDLVVLQLERPRLADRDDHGRARSTTRGNVESVARRASPSTSAARARWPGPNVDARGPRPAGPQPGRGRRPLQGRPRRARSPASASTRRPRTPARTSATCGPTSGTLLATGTFSGESAIGLAAAELHRRRSTSPPGRPTWRPTTRRAGHYSVSSEYYYTPSPVGGNSLDSPPLHAISANRGGANGVYSYAGSSTFPTSTFDGENYAVDVVFAPKLPPGAVGNVTATPGPGSATVNFTAPATGGPPTRYIVTPFIGSAAQPSVTVTGTPPATSVKVGDLDPATSYTFKVQAGNGSGTGPLSAASNAVTPNAPTAAGRPDGPGRQRGQPAGDRALDRAERRRAHDHPLHRHAVPRRRRAGHDLGDRIAGADHRGRDRA